MNAVDEAKRSALACFQGAVPMCIITVCLLMHLKTLYPGNLTLLGCY